MSQNEKWASPTPAGLVALAVVCFMFFALFTGKVTAGALPLMGCWLLGGFVIQFTVGVIELKEGSLTSGNVFLFFSGFFMLTTGIGFFVKYFAAANQWAIPLDTHIDGWAWLVLAIVITLWAPAYFKGTSIMSSIVCILVVAAWLLALMDLGILSEHFKTYAAYALLIPGILAIYLASAIVINTAYGKEKLKVTGPWIKEHESVVDLKNKAQ